MAKRNTFNLSSTPKDIASSVPDELSKSTNLEKSIEELIRKADAYDFVLDNYEKSGFGTLSKSELDLIFFTAIYKNTKNDERSDYKLSRRLQITQTRVRNMKEKASVKYLKMDKDVAIDLFMSKIRNGHFHDRYIDIPLYDIAVKNVIESILEENNMMLHTQLNPKIFRLALEDIVDLLIILETEKRVLDTTGKYQNDPELIQKTVRSKFLTSMQDNYKKGNNATEAIIGKGSSIKDITLDTFKEGILKGSVALSIDAISTFLPGGFLLKPALKKISDAIVD